MNEENTVRFTILASSMPLRAQQNAPGGRIVEDGIVRAPAKIGPQNLAYNVSPPGDVGRLAAA